MIWSGNKGCPTVLIPARVVQALQLHFDQIAATSGPTKPAGFPALNGSYLILHLQTATFGL